MKIKKIALSNSKNAEQQECYVKKYSNSKMKYLKIQKNTSCLADNPFTPPFIRSENMPYTADAFCENSVKNFTSITQVKQSKKRKDCNSKGIELIKKRYHDIFTDYKSTNNLNDNFNHRNSSEDLHYEHISEFNSSINRLKKGELENIWCVAIAPVHLKGMEAICKVFGKSRNTIKTWCKNGAPIAFDGYCYYAEYMTLFTWFLNYFKVSNE